MSSYEESMQGVEGSDAGQTQVAEAGAVVTALPSTRVAGVVRVNLLPPEIAEAQTLRRIKLGAAAGLAAAAAIVGLLWYQQGQKLSDAKDDLAREQQINDKIKADQAKYGNVDALFQQVDAAKATLASASAYELHVSSVMDELSLRTPKNVYVTDLALTETPGGLPLPGAAAPATTGTPAATAPAASATGLGTVTVKGVGLGSGHETVANWLDGFAKITGLSTVYLTSSTEALVGTGGNAVPTVNWVSSAALTLDALAGKDIDGSAGK